MAHTPLILAQFDGDATYANGGAGGTGTVTGAVRYRTGHDPAVLAALVEEGTTNWARNPSAENSTTEVEHDNGWGFTGSATRTKSSEQASDGTSASKLVVAAVADSGGTYPPGAQAPAATVGQAWTMSVDLYGDGSDLRLGLAERNSGNTVLAIHDDTAVSVPVGWSRYDYTYTLDQATAAKVHAYVRNVGTDAATFYMDRAQIEQKDHATTYCPEYTGTMAEANLNPGYTRGGGGEATGFAWYTRAAASVSIPTAAPTWVACRYSEDLGATWAFAYITTLSGNNVGSYGRISHDGTNLVVASDRALLVGPLYAGTGSLDTTEQAALDSEPTWTFGMALGSNPPVVDAGADATITAGQTFTRTASFTDSDSTSWTATVDYGAGAGPQAATVDQVNKMVALSHTYAAAGTYTVTVSVTDDSGSTGSDTVTVTVNEAPPAPTLGAFVVLSVPGTDASAPVITL